MIGVVRAGRLFRGHVIDRAHHRVGAGELMIGSGLAGRVDASQAHVENLHHAFLVEQEIGGLDVAMDDTVFLSKTEAVVCQELDLPNMGPGGPGFEPAQLHHAVVGRQATTRRRRPPARLTSFGSSHYSRVSIWDLCSDHAMLVHFQLADVEKMIHLLADAGDPTIDTPLMVRKAVAIRRIGPADRC